MSSSVVISIGTYTSIAISIITDKHIAILTNIIVPTSELGCFVHIVF